jgi:formamidopyrimidine-DNA glycosylase
VPELPDVEDARQHIEAHGLHRRIAAVDDGDTYVSRPHAPGEIADALIGRELTAAHRRGKAMWIETSDDGPILGLHLGMAGRIAIDEEPSEQGWDRFVLRFEDGGTLALRDKRRLGRARLGPDIDALGPDAGEVDREEFRRLVAHGRGPIKARLMDQAVIAGIGNLMADEILWRACLDPRRPAGDLDDAERDRLWRDMRTIIRMSNRRGHAGVSEVIPERRRGGHCPRCGTEMARGTIGGRTTYWCPREQR